MAEYQIVTETPEKPVGAPPVRESPGGAIRSGGREKRTPGPRIGGRWRRRPGAGLPAFCVFRDRVFGLWFLANSSRTATRAKSVGIWPDSCGTVNLFLNEDMRLYLPLSVGLAFKESHGAARNWRRLLIYH